jgi:hypothetical protein
MILKGTKKELKDLEDLFVEALTTDGAHHKQWYLEEISKLLGIEIDDSIYEKGIAP